MWLTQRIDGQLPTGPKDVKFGAQGCETYLFRVCYTKQETVR